MKTVEANIGRPFQWGEWDCCIFVADCVKEMTGEDPMAEYRGRYHSRAEAKQLAPNGLVPVLSEMFGPPRRTGRKGDIALHPRGLGICIGKDCVFLGDDEYTVLPKSDIRRFFHV